MSKVAYETRIAERFANWLSGHTGRLHTVRCGPNPPDFLLSSGTWLELTDIYLSNEEAKFENSHWEKTFSFNCSPNEPALRLLQKLNQKLAKTSYREIYERKGRGILLLTCQDSFFDEVNLAHVHQALESFLPTSDQGFFKIAYFEYGLDGRRFYDPIYPTRLTVSPLGEIPARSGMDSNQEEDRRNERPPRRRNPGSHLVSHRLFTAPDISKMRRIVASPALDRAR